jgi:hypothetical protein
MSRFLFPSFAFTINHRPDEAESLNGESSLRPASRARCWKPENWPFPGIVEWCGNPALMPLGVVRVVGFSLPLLWHAAALPEQAEAASKALFEGVKTLHDGGDLLRALARNVGQFFGVDVINAVNCGRVLEAALRREPPRRLILPGDSGTEL